MKTYVAGTVSAVLLGLASLAQAGQLVSPPLPTHPFRTNTSSEGLCRIRNTGTTPVKVTVSMLSNNGMVHLFDNCQGDGGPRTLAAGQSCSVMKQLPDDSFVACKVTAPDVTKLRGTLEVDHNFNTNVAVDLE